MARNKDLLYPGEVAKLAGVDAKTVTRWADAGLLPVAFTFPSGHRRYRRTDVDAFLAKLQQPGQSYVLSWDCRQQPDLDELAKAIQVLSMGRVHLTQVDTGSDEYAIVLAGRPLDAEEAYRVWFGDDA